MQFLILPFWHIVKDSSLIILQQWQRAASPFRLSRTTEAGVWFLNSRAVFSQILYYFHQRLHLEYPGGESAPPLIALPPSSPLASSFSLRLSQEKNASVTLIRTRSREYWLVVTALIFPLWHAVQCPFHACLWQSLNIHEALSPYGSSAEFVIGPSKEIHRGGKQHRNNGQLKQRLSDIARGLIGD